MHHGMNHKIIRQDFARAEGGRLYDLAMDAFVEFVRSSYSEFVWVSCELYIKQFLFCFSIRGVRQKGDRVRKFSLG